MTLKGNLRVNTNDKEFKKWLLNIGDGIFSSNFENNNEVIKVPKKILGTYDIVNEIYDNSNGIDFEIG